MTPLTLLVVGDPTARFLGVLERLPDSTRIVVGKRVEAFVEAAPEAGVILNALGPRDVFEAVWRMAPEVLWVHSMSAGLENTLFRELIESPVPLTNSRGVFSRSLAEWVAAAMLFFAKDLGRLVRSQQAGRWERFDVEELHGKTLGLVGFGSIGEAIAERVRALGVKIAAFRRRPELSGHDPLVERVFGPGGLREMLALSDYVAVTMPLTPETRGLIGENELGAMKNTAVLINVGRGPVIVEDALVGALRERQIRGAALDVFDVEPLPAGHPFYSLDNLLLSPHCADHVPEWAEDAMRFFVSNFERFVNGEPLANVVDKKAGY